MAWRTQLVVATGSSPRTRGTLSNCPGDIGDLRFIPAYAGNAARGAFRRPGRSVHPRMRGERGFAPGIFASTIGSSPHARGTRQCGHRRPDLLRFIPACAGNASASLSDRARATVHPRMRGERISTVTRTELLYGSSPHARGTHWRCTLERHRRRFIPACAGNASRERGCSGCLPVHPRMRGERSSTM